MTTITIAPSKQSNVEFDLSIQGLDDDNQVSVRLVILNLFDTCNLDINCKRIKGDKWAALVPADIPFDQDKYKFRIEVVVNEYYFEPASGDVNIVSDPVVKMQENSRPVITASFTSTVVEDVEPLDTNEPLVNVEIDTPIGETNKVTQDPVADIPHVPVDIIPVVMEEKKPKRGSLFDRTPDGKPRVKGLDSVEVANKKLENTLKVQQILNKH